MGKLRSVCANLGASAPAPLWDSNFLTGPGVHKTKPMALQPGYTSTARQELSFRRCAVSGLLGLSLLQRYQRANDTCLNRQWFECFSEDRSNTRDAIGAAHRESRSRTGRQQIPNSD